MFFFLYNSVKKRSYWFVFLLQVYCTIYLLQVNYRSNLMFVCVIRILMQCRCDRPTHQPRLSRPGTFIPYTERENSRSLKRQLYEGLICCGVALLSISTFILRFRRLSLWRRFDSTWEAIPTEDEPGWKSLFAILLRGEYPFFMPAFEDTILVGNHDVPSSLQSSTRGNILPPG